MPKNYAVRGKMGKKAQKELQSFGNLTATLLYNRGIKTKKEAEEFLNPDFIRHLHDPFLLPDMEKAAERVLKAIDKNERVAIWSDYDADGIPGGALLHDFFRQIGFRNFEIYIPDRHTEGYGLNIEGIEKLKEVGTGLLITLDCGIRNNKETEHAKKSGMDVIVTDHHEPGDELPGAFAVVNPKRKDSEYPEKILCGAGVAWKLVEAVLKKKRSLLKEGHEKWLLDLAGLATLSDMVPLTGENRALAHFGLSVLRKTRRPGFNKLFSALRVNKSNLTGDDVVFSVAPRINAASRMGHPMDAFKLLTAEDESEAGIYVRHLDCINNERRGMVASIVKEAKKRIKEKFEAGEKPVVVLGNPDWRPALLGLAAGSLAEEFNRPVFLWGRENGEFIKGSCRSDGSTDIIAVMEKAKEFFIEFGGHKLSGGFSVIFEKVHTLEEALVKVCSQNEKNISGAEVMADAELSLRDLSEETASEIARLAPFGTGNEKPIFIFRDVIPEKISRFGKNKEHLSVNLRDGAHSARAISFFSAPERFGHSLVEGIKTNLAANIEKSFWNGSSELRLRVVDFFK